MLVALQPYSTTIVLDRLATAFSAAGHRIYLVGGSVRDELLDRPLKDLDFTTDAHPDETRIILALTKPITIHDVGARFGTIAAIFEIDDQTVPVEITTFRSETYDPGSRKPKVDFGTSLEADLARRDFTINAIARDLYTRRLIDPFDGQGDLGLKLVRAVGSAIERFTEDPLRLLRAVRLSVELDFMIDHPTLTAMSRSSDQLASISRERIAEELNRILLSPEPGRGFRMLAELGLLRKALPELIPLRETASERRFKNVFEHTLRVVEGTPSDQVIRWSALLHDIGKPRTLSFEDGQVRFIGHELVGENMSRKILTNLHFDRETTERVARLVGLHMRANQYADDWTDGAVRRLMREVGDDLDRLLNLSSADVTSYRAEKVAAAHARVDALRERARQIAEREDIAALRSPLDGNELMELFDRPPGPWIKPIKDYLLDLVLDGELGTDDRERATDLAQAFLSEKSLA